MRAYTYRPKEVGLAAWPSGELRLEGMEPTSDPAQADVFICPGPLLLSQDPAWLDRFPHMSGNEERHIFFDCSDHDTIYNRKNCILIRCNLKRWMLEAHPNSISFAWPVEDYAECMAVPEGGLKFDISGHMWLSTDTRIQSVDSCRKTPGLKSDIATYADFTGYIFYEPEGIRRRAEFRRSMRESRLALCPESIPGVFPYRFFEAMSAGRVPVLVASEVVFPFAEEVPYSNFILHIERADAARAGEHIKEFLAQHDDRELIELGEAARWSWEKYLDCRKWPSLMSYAVQKQMRKMGLTKETPVLCA